MRKNIFKNIFKEKINIMNKRFNDFDMYVLLMV